MSTISSNFQSLIQDLRSYGFNVEQKNGKYYVKIDNLSVPVNPYDDVFSIMKKYTEQKQQAIKEYNNSRYDKEIEAGKEKVSEYSNMFDYWLGELKKERHNFINFLSNNGVSQLSELKDDKEKYKQGLSIQEAKYMASFMKNKALSRLISASNKTVSACCHKIMYSC